MYEKIENKADDMESEDSCQCSSITLFYLSQVPGEEEAGHEQQMIAVRTEESDKLNA